MLLSFACLAFSAVPRFRLDLRAPSASPTSIRFKFRLEALSHAHRTGWLAAEPLPQPFRRTT
jgi:hypothetical protein